MTDPIDQKDPKDPRATAPKASKGASHEEWHVRDGESLTDKVWYDHTEESKNALVRRLRSDGLTRKQIVMKARELGFPLKWSYVDYILRGTKLEHRLRLARHTIRYKGQDMTANGLARMLGIHPATIYARLKRGETGAELMRPVRYAKHYGQGQGQDGATRTPGMKRAYATRTAQNTKADIAVRQRLPKAELSDDDVDEIRRLALNTQMPHHEIASIFAITLAHVEVLIKSRRWDRRRKTYVVSLPDPEQGGKVVPRRLTVTQVARLAGVPRVTIATRLRRGVRDSALLAPPHRGPRKPRKPLVSSQIDPRASQPQSVAAPAHTQHKNEAAHPPYIDRYNGNASEQVRPSDLADLFDGGDE